MINSSLIHPSKKKNLISSTVIFFENTPDFKFHYPENIRIPNVGEYVWFDDISQGYVDKIENKLDDNNFVTTIFIKNKYEKN